MGDNQLPINISGLVVAALLVTAAALDHQPLQSQRPPTAPIHPETSGPFERIPARIWEDPLQAAARVATPDEDTPDIVAYCNIGGTTTPAETAVPLSRSEPPPSDTSPTAPNDSGTAASSSESSETPERSCNGNVVESYLHYLSSLSTNSRLLIMPVMVSGAPYGAAHEQRLRRRTAIHAALFDKAFRPLRGNRIGLWRWRIQGDQQLDVPFEAFKKDTGNDHRIVLILWLADEAISRDYASETRGRIVSKTGPLARIDQMLAEIGYPPQRKAPRHGSTDDYLEPEYKTYDGFRSSAVRVIGPTSSDSLEALYGEIIRHDRLGQCNRSYDHVTNTAQPDDQDQKPWRDNPLGFAIVSPMATAPKASLGAGNPRRFKDATWSGNKVELTTEERAASKAWPCASIALYRTIGTDDKTIAALIDELRLRGIDPTRPEGGHTDVIPAWLNAINSGAGKPIDGSRDHIVLISEWDTKFGRTLPKLFEKQVAGQWCCAALTAAAADPSEQTCNQEALKSCAKNLDSSLGWIHSFAYMRGLDGARSKSDRTSTGKTAGAGGKPDIVALATGTEAGFKEPAIGTNQYDYLRRMTLELLDLDRHLRQTDQGAIKAFGILGNDYFDKLLILEALREEFPSHLYFTTDLDAGFLDAKVFRNTRNLVIAAPFGLTLRRAFEDRGGSSRSRLQYDQGAFAPFRHSIQTSVRLATRATLDGPLDQLSLAVEKARPLIFEVGRNHFFQLDGDTRPTGQSVVQVDLPYRVSNIDLDDLSDSQPKARQLRLTHLIETRIVTLLLILLAVLLTLRSLIPGLKSASSKGSPWLRRTTNAVFAPLGRRLASASDWLRHRWPASGDRRARRPAVLICAHPFWALGLLSLPLAGGLLFIIEQSPEPFTLLGGISIWPSEIIRLVAGVVSCALLVYGWRQAHDADQRIARQFDLPCDLPPGQGPFDYAQWHPGLRRDRNAERIAAETCRLFGRRNGDAKTALSYRPDAREEWRHYCDHSTLGGRAQRVIPAALAFWVMSLLAVYAFTGPASPHRGELAYWLSVCNAWILAGFPFLVLLFAAVDESILISGLLGRLEGARPRWPLRHYELTAGCHLDVERFGPAIDHWLTTELIATRTGPAAQVVHLPLIVILFLLLSLSTRFDNWNTPVVVIMLCLVSVGIAVLASWRLRSCAHRIRNRLLADLDMDIGRIEYASAATDSERLRALATRIKQINAGAFTKWYNEPVIRALAWVAAIAILVVTEYARVG